MFSYAQQRNPSRKAQAIAVENENETIFSNRLHIFPQSILQI
jgi:hypothetical protein